jgi:hypothetical protein
MFMFMVYLPDKAKHKQCKESTEVLWVATKEADLEIKLRKPNILSYFVTRKQ